MGNYPEDGYILTVCLNPTLQKTLVLSHMWENEVNRSREYYFDVSGKGINLSRVLLQLGFKVVHLTHLGGLFKDFFLERCRQEQIHVGSIDSGTEIRFCYTLLNREKHTTTEIVEESCPVPGNAEKLIFGEFEKWLPGAAMVIISGSKAAGYSDYLYSAMTRTARAGNKPVILDIRGQDLVHSLVYAPEIIKPNYAEFIGTFYKETDIRESSGNDAFLEIVRNKMQTLYQEYGVKTVLTRGKYPVLYYDGRAMHFSPPRECTSPVNTTGCGDAFTAGLAAGLMKGSELAQAVQLGNDCAWRNAMTPRPGFLYPENAR